MRAAFALCTRACVACAVAARLVLADSTDPDGAPGKPQARLRIVKHRHWIQLLARYWFCPMASLVLCGWRGGGLRHELPLPAGREKGVGLKGFAVHCTPCFSVHCSRSLPEHCTRSPPVQCTRPPSMHCTTGLSCIARPALHARASCALHTLPSHAVHVRASRAVHSLASHALHTLASRATHRNTV